VGLSGYLGYVAQMPRAAEATALYSCHESIQILYVPDMLCNNCLFETLDC
jgi:hypothetical protein